MTGKDGSIITVHEWMDEFMLLRLMRELWPKDLSAIEDEEPPDLWDIRWSGDQIIDP